MKKTAIIFSILCLLSAFASGQTTMLDDFEIGIGTWTTTGWPTLSQVTTDGADSTAASMQIDDPGWGVTAEKTYTAIVPADGDYKLTFFYKNGPVDDPIGTGTPPGSYAKIRVNSGAKNSEVSLKVEKMTIWEAAETPFIYGLTAGSDIKVEFLGNTGSTLAVDCRLDQLAIVKGIPPVTVQADPPSGYIVTGVAPITAIPSGGSGSYTKAEYDVDDDGSIEFTDDTPVDGFIFNWDTEAYTSETVSAIPIKITITDSALETGFITPVYGFDNRCDGRVELVINGDFENWTSTYPAAWNILDVDADGNPSTNPGNAIVEKETVAPFAGANSLKVTFGTQDTVFRYTMRSNPFSGEREDYILQYYGKGGTDCRMCYFESDNGFTWVSTWHLIESGSSADAWKQATDAPWTRATQIKYLSIATHKFNGNASYWDEVSITSSGDCSEPPEAATTWEMYY